MKNIKKLGLLLFSCVLVSGSAFSDSGPITFKPQSIRLVPQNTFIPPGFDDHDNVQMVISGYLPNTCYKAAAPKIQVDSVEKKITIQNTAYFYSGCWCAQMTVPYQHTIDLGILPFGRYRVFVQDQKDQLYEQGVLKVAVSKTASPDDYLYAPVQDVFLEQPASSQSNFVIRGQFSSDCMHLQETKILYRSSHIIEILPIATLDEGRECHATPVPFEAQLKIQSPWTGSTLIYVRSLNGQAISKVLDL